MGRHGRLGRVKKKLPGAASKIRIGGGRTITATPQDRYEMFLSALGGRLPSPTRCRQIHRRGTRGDDSSGS